MSTPIANVSFPTPPQQEVQDCGLLRSGFDCLLQMPTGSGKTWLAEQAIGDVLDAGRRALYLTPLRSLADELTSRWQQRFAPHPVGVFTGDYGRAFPLPFRQARLLVLTPERLDACTRCWPAHWEWLPEVDLLVVDEFHLLGDRQRGARLEGTISRVRRLNPFVRLLGLSATLGNRGELADWLGAVDYGSSWRPIPLRWRIVRYRQPAAKPELLRDIVAANVQDGGMGLVFVQSRRRAEEVGAFLQNAGLRAAHHHAGLDREARRAVEGRFHERQVDVLVATSTLEMGLNLPARQVVLYDLQAFDGGEFRPLPCWNVWQRAGRAGRPGLDREGEVVLLAATWDRETARYIEGNFEPVRSGLAQPRALAEQIVAEVGAGLARSPDQLRRVFASSLAARQGTLPHVDVVLREMRDARMIEEVRSEERGARLRATRLGRIAVRHFLAPATVLLFRRALDAQPDWTFFDLLLLAACCDDCEPLLPVDWEELEQLGVRLARERSRLLPSAVLFGATGRRLLAALKTALTARDWTRHGDVERTATNANIYPFEVRRLVETMDRLLGALAAVAETDEAEPTPSDNVSMHERLRALRRMMHGGLDEETVTLTLVAGIGPIMARRLRQAGIEDLETLAQTEHADLAKIKRLSPTRAERWIAQATELIPTCSAFRYREIGPSLEIRGVGWPADIDPYRLRRTRELTVAGGPDDFRVSGGLEPHRVACPANQWTCDCPDRADGNVCKHILAVRLHRGDPELREQLAQLEAAAASQGLDLFGLWFATKTREKGSIR